MTNAPSKFDAFRIHDDADGYRGGIEPVSYTHLTLPTTSRV